MTRSCSTRGCRRPYFARGLCRNHHERWMRLGADRPRCAVTACPRAMVARGWCSPHYTRWRRYGSTEIVHPKRVRFGTRYINQAGYVMVLAPGHPEAAAHGWAYEHRKKWHDRYGPIPPRMIVHHRNDDKQDNHLRNLRLMTRAEHTAHHQRERRRAA